MVSNVDMNLIKNGYKLLRGKTKAGENVYKRVLASQAGMYREAPNGHIYKDPFVDDVTSSFVFKIGDRTTRTVTRNVFLAPGLRRDARDAELRTDYFDINVNGDKYYHHVSANGNRFRVAEGITTKEGTLECKKTYDTNLHLLGTENDICSL